MAERRPGWTARRPVLREALLAGVLTLLLAAFATPAIPLLGRDEGRFAQAAREMLARDEMVVPTFGGAPRYDKPILIYWCTVASYAAFGVGAAAARVPSNLAAALTVALVAAAARRRFGPGAGLTAGLLLASTLTFHLQAKACTADQVMLLPATVALLALWRLLEGHGGRAAALALWVGTALAVLAKGPVAPAALAATGAAWWALGRRWRRAELVAGGLVLAAAWWWGPQALAAAAVVLALAALARPSGRALLGRLRPAWGVPLLLAIVLPWTVAAWRATDGEFFRVAVGRHVIERATGALESHAGIPGFYLLTAVVAAFPLAGVLAGRLSRLREAAADPRRRFLLAAVLGPMVLLELVRTKLVHYWLPSYPAAALLAAALLADDPERPLEGAGRGGLVAGAALVAAVPIVVAAHFEVPGLLAPTVAAALPLAAVAAAAPRGRPARRTAGIAVAGTAGFLLLLSGLVLPRLAPHLVAPSTAAAVAQAQRPDEPLVVYRLRDDELLFMLPAATEVCRDEACLARALERPERSLVVVREEELARFLAGGRAQDVVVVAAVRGLDLGRGRWATNLLVRSLPPG